MLDCIVGLFPRASVLDLFAAEMRRNAFLSWKKTDPACCTIHLVTFIGTLSVLLRFYCASSLFIMAIEMLKAPSSFFKECDDSQGLYLIAGSMQSRVGVTALHALKGMI